jgi:hypothetical protein
MSDLDAHSACMSERWWLNKKGFVKSTVISGFICSTEIQLKVTWDH